MYKKDYVVIATALNDMLNKYVKYYGAEDPYFIVEEVAEHIAIMLEAEYDNFNKVIFDAAIRKGMM